MNAPTDVPENVVRALTLQVAKIETLMESAVVALVLLDAEGMASVILAPGCERQCVDVLQSLDLRKLALLVGEHCE